MQQAMTAVYTWPYAVYVSPSGRGLASVLVSLSKGNVATVTVSPSEEGMASVSISLLLQPNDMKIRSAG